MSNDEMSLTSIPKTIHYCWFGGNELGPEELRCIESWREFFPDYIIKRWDESNFDVESCDYSKEAYAKRKWAFVSDYARFKILYEEGGIYFDTDVEVVQGFDDLIHKGPIMGMEATKPHSKEEENLFYPTVNPGLILSSAAGDPFYQEVVSSYETDRFILDDGSLNMRTVVTRVTELLCKHGLRSEPVVQKVAGIWIYPPDYFNPKDYWSGIITRTHNTRTIHHFKMSWLTDAQRFEHDIREALLRKGCSNSLADEIAKWVATLRYLDYHRLIKKIKKIIRNNDTV